MKDYEHIYHESKEIIQEYVDQQGHNRCWYYPDLFRSLVKLFEVDASKEPALPPLEEFKEGCRRYQQEEFGEKISDVL
ncbi:hypothetical protein A3D11_03145 [Candidatus Peribacteria bacterium RIFCSPHIGHO2_02_FULL_49_16]|nr:MAG: hypothetical protein A2880_03010 [Candidatus Peribacteria bacterium RIFCSPHIGHO2_01_FULL_49_38]OGJ59317.1 MAG: hypothetical protein A3D11_03145 [Candidatus Peribacteria bacterium RIFCSPHIGHO2_02_FULL_49_16]